MVTFADPLVVLDVEQNCNDALYLDGSYAAIFDVQH